MDSKRVPEIRFKSFNEEWEEKFLGEIVDVRSGKDYKHLSAGKIPVYGTGGYMLSVDEALSYNDDAIGIGRKGTIDNPFILKAPFWTVDTLFYSVPHKGYDLNFVYSLFQNVNWREKDESTGVPSLSRTTINNVNVNISNIKEQEKLGSFFSNIDQQITAIERKIAKLCQIKDGLLLKMFPREGEVVPEIRFKGFTDPWEQRKLGDIATFINGRAYSQDELLEKGKYKVLRVGNFYTNDSWYYSDLELEENKYADTGDLLYTWSATFGPHIWDGGKVIYHYHIWKVDLSEELDKLFALQLLERDKSQLLNNSNGSTMIHITKKNMEDKLVYIPQVEEQEKIGQFFKKVDQTITLHQRKLEKFKQIKESLLLKMFV